MKNPIVKSTFAILLSIVTALVLVVAIEGISAVLHPFPEDFSGSMEALAAHVAAYPPWVLALLGGVGYGAVMFICTYVATRFGHRRRRWHGYGVGAFLFALVVFNMMQLPYPAWYGPMVLIVLPAAAYFGTRRGSAGSPT